MKNKLPPHLEAMNEALISLTEASYENDIENMKLERRKIVYLSILQHFVNAYTDFIKDNEYSKTEHSAKRTGCAALIYAYESIRNTRFGDSLKECEAGFLKDMYNLKLDNVRPVGPTLSGMPKDWFSKNRKKLKVIQGGKI